MMKIVKKLSYIVLYISLGQAFANSIFTTIESGVALYSEYYLNSNVKFHGTIVFENGSGMALTQWTDYEKFVSCAKKQGSLFLYDRSGLGKSRADYNISSVSPVTADLVSRRLLKLLQQNHMPTPYVIIGHSFGGLYADYFARRYPSLVKGLLLIDPTPQNLIYSDLFKKNQAYLESWVNIPNYKLYKEHTFKDEVASGYKIPAAAVFYEGQGINKTREQIRKLATLPNGIPVIILSSSQMESANVMKYDWFKGQKKYLNKNSKSKAMMLDSSHTVWDKYPNVVCQQIKLLTQ